MSPCQTCTLLGHFSGGDVKLRTSDIHKSAGNGCGGCTLLLDAIDQFGGGKGNGTSESTEIWCQLSYLPGVKEGSRSHFQIDFEENADASSFGIELFTSPGAYLNPTQYNFCSFKLAPLASGNHFAANIDRVESVVEPDSRPLLLPGVDIFGTSSDSSKAQLRDWIDRCSRHRSCAEYFQTTSKLPTRVIDVGQGRLDSPIRLHISGGECAPYLCLSHCWGRAHPFRTKSSTLEQHQRLIEFDALPQTFQ